MLIGTHEEMAADVRVVAATKRKPEQAVADGTLREDLYHRLSVFPLELPPLREREDDVILLADSFLQKLNEENRTSKKFDPEPVQARKKYSWRGIIRELSNSVYRSYIRADKVIKGEINSFESKRGKAP